MQTIKPRACPMPTGAWLVYCHVQELYSYALTLNEALKTHFNKVLEKARV